MAIKLAITANASPLLEAFIAGVIGDSYG